MRSVIAALAALVPFLTASYAAPTGDMMGSGPVLYFLENLPKGNKLVSVMPMQGSDHVTYMKTSTGGKGLRGFFGNKTAGPDSLFAQSTVMVSGNMLFTVNPGSNTVVMFAIDPTNPMEPMMVGKPMDTLGEFPMSVAFSEELMTACVLNGGKIAGVTCYSVDAKSGMTCLDKAPRAVPSGFMQTTPPVGPGMTTSQVSFTPDNKNLVVAIKGNPGAKPAVPGWIQVFPVSDGMVSMTATTSSVDSLLVPFGFGFFSDNTMLISDPSHGASVISLGANDMATSLSEIMLSNFSAACWATTTPSMNMGFVIDAGTPQVAVVDASTNMLSMVLQTPMRAKGGFDAIATDSMLYLLAATHHIIMVDLMNDYSMTLLDLGRLGQRPSWEGLAMWQPM